MFFSGDGGNLPSTTSCASSVFAIIFFPLAILHSFRARFERSPLGTYISLGNQDNFNEGVTRGSVRRAQRRSYSRIRVPCRDRSISAVVYVRAISKHVRFQNGLSVAEMFALQSSESGSFAWTK